MSQVLERRQLGGMISKHQLQTRMKMISTFKIWSKKVKSKTFSSEFFKIPYIYYVVSPKLKDVQFDL